jgi:glycosyltransferase involved in cell wall biosynthesis
MSRVCLVYDCLFPHTVGGAERWLRRLSERLAADGHEVTYLTLRQWETGVDPDVPGVRVIAVGPRLALYTDSGRRKIVPPLVFGMGVLLHLLRHGRRYDTVHTASFPYFSLLAAALARPLGRYGLVVEWHEAWTLEYWRDYLGRLGGRIGWAVQRRCVGLRQQAFCFSQLHADRLMAEGMDPGPVVLRGEYVGPLEPRPSVAHDQTVVFAGRFIPEKRVDALVPTMGRLTNRLPELRCDIYGDGPERLRVQTMITERGLAHRVRLHGFVDTDTVQDAIARALCFVLPSSREGYGMVVIEATSYGTPAIVVAGPDNAAVEFIEPGINGFVATSAAPEDLAEAVLAVQAGGEALRRSTAEWFAEHAQELSLDSSLQAVTAAYAARRPPVAARS